MSKSNKSKSKRRVAHRNAKPQGLPFEMPTPRSNTYLSQIEDRRTYNPSGVTSPARAFSKPMHELVIPTPKNRDRVGNRLRNSTLPTAVAFKQPEKVLVCVRRKIRKEVLHAIKKTGKTGQKRPRRSYYSDIHC